MKVDDEERGILMFEGCVGDHEVIAKQVEGIKKELNQLRQAERRSLCQQTRVLLDISNKIRQLSETTRARSEAIRLRGLMLGAARP